MQEDSPGRREKRTRNDRYGTPTQPKRLSASSARQKAKDYAAKDNKSTRVLAKQAILKELNTHLFVRAQGLSRKHSQEGDEPEPTEVKKKERKEVRPVSRIPRRVDGTHANRTKKGQLKPQPKPSDVQQETLLSDRADKRFQETRIRFLAKKYATLWKRRTYGRVDPFVARMHYERNLKQCTLQVWQDIWWAGRKGWKLNIRAEYHNRYRLWQKAWKAWREYIKYCRSKRAKEKLALRQAHHTLLKRCWTGWTHYVRTRRTKTQQSNKAQILAEKHLKRRVWGSWLARLAFRHDLRDMDQEALQFWAINLVSKAWRVWTSAWYANNEERSKIADASRLADRNLVLKVWRGWKNYRAVRKLKLLQQGAADRHFSKMLLKKSLSTWAVRWQRQVELAQFDDLILFKGDIALARRAFVHWKFYIVMKHEEYEQEQAADHHYILHLLKTCFHSLHLQAVQKRLKEIRSKMAADTRQRFQLQRVWNMWIKRCEHSEELKLHSISRKARAHHSFKVKRKVLLCWVRYCQWRRFRKSQYGKADYHFREKALPRFFCRMMIFVDVTHLEKEDDLAAKKFRREALMAKMFYKWWSKYQLHMDIGLMQRMAILHHDEVMKRRFLQFWGQRARNKLREKQREVIADNHHHRRLLFIGILRWREFNRETKESRSVHHSSVRHYYISLLKKTWEAWQQFVHGRQVKWQEQARADLHYQQRLLSRVLHSWKSYQKHVDNVNVQSNQRLEEYNVARLRFAFKTWQLNAAENREERKNKHVAKTFLYQTLLAKSFSCWREYASQRGVKKYQQMQRLHEIQQKLDEGKRSRAFRAWKSFTRKSVQEKDLRSQASRHYNKTLLHKAVDSWKNYIHLCFRIKILQRQSMWLHNRRITAAFFRRWKKQHRILVQEKRRTVLALWHWSVNLQIKAFFALMEYAIARKRKAVRVARALEDRRNRLVRTGVTQWMKVGFHLAAERARFAQTRQLEAAHSVHQCVHRCAMHWRRITAKRIRQRGGKPKPRPVTVGKPDWPGNSALARPVPAALPSSFPGHVDRILPDPFKGRPRPRKPDYLRESYDVAQISMATVASRSIPSTNLENEDDVNEAKPRSSPPLPVNQMRSNVHPHQRNPREESIVFPSSSGEDSFLGQERQRGTGKDPSEVTKAVSTGDKQWLPGRTDKPIHTSAFVPPVHKPQTRGPQRRPVLLPPSSFSLPSRTKRSPLHQAFTEGEEVRVSCSTLPASTPRTSLDSQKCVASSPSSAASSPGRGSEQGEEKKGDMDDENVETDKEDDDESTEEEGNEEGEERDGRAQSEQKEEGSLQERIVAMKNVLQEFHDLKVEYSHKKQQRDQLSVWVREQIEELGPNHEDEELRETERCLNDLTEEVQRLAERTKQSRPSVEKVAARIRELVQKTGLE